MQQFFRYNPLLAQTSRLWLRSKGLLYEQDTDKMSAPAGLNKIASSILLITLMFIACNNDNCSKNLKYVKLDYYLFEHIRVDGNNYCYLVNNSLAGNEESIVKLSKIEVFDGASYEHGAVLLEVIDKISEEKYVNIINKSNLTKKEKCNLMSNLNAGLDYTKNESWQKVSSLGHLYPFLYDVLYLN